MNVRCSHCNTLYRIDPARVPAGGTQARCARCKQTFRIEPVKVPAGAPVASTGSSGEGRTPEAAPPRRPAAAEVPARPAAPDAPPRPNAPQAPARPAAPAAATSPRPAAGVPVFGPQDPEVRARRLARALVSDIVAYHPDRWEASLRSGTLREDFREEILKSWEEYVLQVGAERAHDTPYFRDALNEILAKGRQIF